MNTRVNEAGRKAGLHRQTFDALNTINMHKHDDGVWRSKPKPQLTTKRVVKGFVKLALAAWVASVIGG